VVSIHFVPAFCGQIARGAEPHFADAFRTRPQIWRSTLARPGEPAAREYALRVVMGRGATLRRGWCQFDDYFYPDPEKDAAGRELNFIDDAQLAEIWRFQRFEP